MHNIFFIQILYVCIIIEASPREEACSVTSVHTLAASGGSTANQRKAPMNILRTTAKTRVGLAVAALSLLGLAGVAAPANAATAPSAAPIALAATPEIAVSGASGPGSLGFVIRNEGTTTVPAGTKFTFQSNALFTIGLFGDTAIGQDWSIGALGSGNTVDFYLTNPLAPGQLRQLNLSLVAVSLLSQYSLTLTDPQITTVDTNLNNNTSRIRCLVNLFGLPACSVS